MANDTYLKIGDIKGESRDSKHGDEIDVDSWDWGLSQTGTMHTGGGGGAGRANFQDLTVVTKADKALPILMKACANGDHYEDAILTVRKPGAEPIDSLKITMKKVLVTSVTTAGANEVPTYTVMLNFGEVKVEYAPQNDDGSAGAVVEFSYNIMEHANA